MFLSSDTIENREFKIREYLARDPSVALLVAAVNFEWTVCRAVLFLSATPNSILRKRMADFYSLDAYKDLWFQEVCSTRQAPRLASLVRNWSAVRGAFLTRNLLVHGRDRCTKKMAAPHIEALMKGVRDIEHYCSSNGVLLRDRMPVRRAIRTE